MGTAHDENSHKLNKSQVGSLLATFHHMDGLLADIEDMLDCHQTNLLFPQYEADFDPGLRSKIEQQICDFRAAMLSILHQEGIGTQQRKISALHAIASTADFIELAIDDLRPERMRGYGEVSEATKRNLDAMACQMEQLAKNLLRSARHTTGSKKRA